MVVSQSIFSDDIGLIIYLFKSDKLCKVLVDESVIEFESSVHWFKMNQAFVFVTDY